MKSVISSTIMTVLSIGVGQTYDIGDWGVTSAAIMTVSQTAPGAPRGGSLVIYCRDGVPNGVMTVVFSPALDHPVVEALDVWLWVDGRFVVTGTALPLPEGGGVFVLPDIHGALFPVLGDARTLLAQIVLDGNNAPQFLWAVREFPEALSALGCYSAS